MKSIAMILGLAISANVAADFYVGSGMTPEGTEVNLGLHQSLGDCRASVDREVPRYVSTSCALVPEYHGDYTLNVYLANHELATQRTGLGKMDCPKILMRLDNKLQEGERATCSH